MYKLLLVDDEEIELQGMANFIPWNDYGIELIGTAWNGVQALQKVQMNKPDIILTDIKMPVMDGITLIKKVNAIYDSVEFIVLSGYGEYEYTSKAMEEGIRHYLLKPCDEEKIAEIVTKLIAEIEEKRRRRDDVEAYKSTVHHLLPRAREQVFQNMLLGKEQLKTDYLMLMEEIGEAKTIHVVSIACQKNLDYLDQFIISNIFHELMDQQGLLLETGMAREVLFMVDHNNINQIGSILEKLQQELRKLQLEAKQIFISEAGTMDEMRSLYEQLREIKRLSEAENGCGILTLDTMRGSKAETYIDYKNVLGATSYVDILFNIYLMFLKMSLHSLEVKEKITICKWLLSVMYGPNLDKEFEKQDMDEWLVLSKVVDIIAVRQGLEFEETKDAQRFKEMLLAIFRHMQNQELSIQYLAKEVLFMNQDYFGRFFRRHQGTRFSTFLLEQRIGLAKNIMAFDADIKVSALAEMVGYSSDGQYFSKNFRKITGCSPIEYKDLVSASPI